MAQKPARNKYAGWQQQQYNEDSVEWATNPLYGWCNKNPKPDGTPHNIHSDGLKIYSTIDMRMQAYAEYAIKQHLSIEIQPVFNQRLKILRNPPFPNSMSDDEAHNLLNFSVKQSERYRQLKGQGLNHEEIISEFKKPAEMTVFSWRGEIDTTMTPLDSVKYSLGFLRSAMMTMETRTGHVKAWVGGPNYKYFMYDMVKLGKRQVGSTVKPFLYTLAMQNGYSPCTMVPNAEQTFYLPDGTTWTAKNSGNTDYDGQMVTLKWALANSINWISAYLMKRFSPLAVIQMARKMGITADIPPVPSICLGTPDISLYEMVGAVNTFANRGIHINPYFITKIEDKFGNVIAQFAPESNEALNEETAYLMLKLMQGVVESGTGVRLRSKYGFTNEIAGKTGTTQNQSDGWFMGLTPHLTTGVWVGCEDRSAHFRTLQLGQGANTALPIWALYMKKVYADRSLNITTDPFPMISKPLSVDLNCDKLMIDEPIEEETEVEEF